MPGLEGRLIEVADFIVAACLVYVVIVWLKDARARLALVGVGLVGAVYVVAIAADLALTARLLQAAFFISAAVLLLVFREDLRRSFERLAILVLRRERPAPTSSAVDIVARSALALAAAHRGGLVVLPGREPIGRHLEGGVVLDGTVSEPLLLSLFDPSSPGHDGAVVVESNRVRLFAAHLPLSSDFEQLGTRGTRHAAALGLSERCDAVAVVVSEESGTVSVAQFGTLRPVSNAADLAARLRASLGATVAPEHRRTSALRLLQGHAGQMLLALAVTAILWVLLVPGSRPTVRTLVVPVHVDNLPAGYDLRSVTPREVKVTVTGVRRALFFLQPGRLRLTVDAFLVQLGRRTFEISPQSVKCPPEVTVSAVEPERVELSVRSDTPASSSTSPPPPRQSPASTLAPSR